MRLRVSSTFDVCSFAILSLCLARTNAKNSNLDIGKNKGLRDSEPNEGLSESDNFRAQTTIQDSRDQNDSIFLYVRITFYFQSYLQSKVSKLETDLDLQKRLNE